VVAQRHRLGHRLGPVVIRIVEIPTAARPPGTDRRGAVAVPHIAGVGIERRLARRGCRLAVGRIQQRRIAVIAVFGGRRLGLARGLAVRRGIVSFEQRVRFELLLDESRHLDIRQLQQLDRLLQLRRHHQRLGLTQIEALGESHGRGLPSGP
jgi:hypothetical protein